ncbi:hypothetical protein ES703_67286 [subsurface metagenome]
MPKDGKKVAIGAGIVAAVVGAIALIKGKKPPITPIPPPPEGVAATISIEIIGAERNSPVSLEEGGSYIARLTVTNATTKAGTPWEATLTVHIAAHTEFVTLIPVQVSDENFAAGQTRTFDFPMSVPLGAGGQPGNIIARVKDPAGINVATVIEDFTIVTSEIIYGATIVVGV